MTRPVVVGAILARNEAGPDRFLKPCIESLRPACDTILLLDDNSDDGTAEMARALGCRVAIRKNSPPAWGAEAPARQELWWLAAELAGEDGWVLVADADQVLVGGELVPDLVRSWEADGWAWPLYDLWTPTEYRDDGYWQAHHHPRVWLGRVAAFGTKPAWRADSGLHVGHMPPGEIVALVADGVHWLHYGYVTPQLRARKHAQYLSQSDHLNPFQRAHAESILDFD